MKLLGIVCSPRKSSNTEILVREALTSAREAGAKTELLTVAGKNIAGCDGCDSCKKTRKLIRKQKLARSAIPAGPRVITCIWKSTRAVCP